MLTHVTNIHNSTIKIIMQKVYFKKETNGVWTLSKSTLNIITIILITIAGNTYIATMCMTLF